MKLKTWHYIAISSFLILLVIITYQTFSYKTQKGQLTNIEALSELAQTELSGRELTKDEIESGQFNNLKVAIDGMTCLSCSDTLFYGLINMKGIVNAQVSDGLSCVIYNKNEISRADIINSELFKSGVYMAAVHADKEIRSEEDAKCL